MSDENEVPWDFEARHGTRFKTEGDNYRVQINSPYHRVPITDLAEYMAEEAPDQMARKIGIDGVYKPGEVYDVDLPSIRATALLREFLLEVKGQADEDFEEAVEELLEWTPEMHSEAMYPDVADRVRRPGYVEEMEQVRQCPFFSEAYLYNLLGKQDARTLLALMRPIWEAAGIPRTEQP